MIGGTFHELRSSNRSACRGATRSRRYSAARARASVAWSPAVLSRVEGGERPLSTEELDAALAEIGTEEAKAFAARLAREWRLIAEPAFDDPDADLLWEAEQAAAKSQCAGSATGREDFSSAGLRSIGRSSYRRQTVSRRGGIKSYLSVRLQPASRRRFVEPSGSNFPAQRDSRLFLRPDLAASHYVKFTSNEVRNTKSLSSLAPMMRCGATSWISRAHCSNRSRRPTKKQMMTKAAQ